MTLAKRESLTNQIALGYVVAARPAGLASTGTADDGCGAERRNAGIAACAQCQPSATMPPTSSQADGVDPPLTTVTGTRTGFG